MPHLIRAETVDNNKVQEILDSIVDQFHEIVVVKKSILGKDAAMVLEKVVKIQQILDAAPDEEEVDLSKVGTEDLLKMCKSSASLIDGEVLKNDPIQP